MSKAKRLNEMIMMVNRRKRFTVRELAQEFEVSKRTILRDLQELSEMGVPLYSEAGPHGGYQVLNERILPPIAFSEDEAIAIFFAMHALRHYISLPFDIEFESIKKKFYLNLSGDTRDAIDRMKDRVDFVSALQQEEIPFLKQLLEASIEQEVIIINYEKNGKITKRSIQPIGIYATEGKWYCPSYCFYRKDYRVFRCDRITSVELDENNRPIDFDLSKFHLKNRFSLINKNKDTYQLNVELTKKGVEMYKPTKWLNVELTKRDDGLGFLKGDISKDDINFFSNHFISYGEEAIIKSPTELIDCMKEKLNKILNQYS
ncbi:helix-turn-helix transcriptional regulator [Schinkia azotoformans]|uniref:helix-turn-helix transcriptional regulator n=1 Tax=Schinkia azotoformans TaxID=1454 RepID=UPI002DBEC831|nr:YafY family protein [Schinkia azotoformans]MEC1773693.1 YafY family protein [Schinkia azotoformans]MED4366158.1 YafY family protein [Schinkia azotoformans]MED4376547.1 YafY family protein [Schinkia azotoformans]